MWFKNVRTLVGLKKHYKELVKIYHPDILNTGDEKVFKEITDEYNALKQTLPKKIYNVYATCNDIIMKKTFEIDDDIKIIIPNKHCKEYALKKMINGNHYQINVYIKDYPKDINNIIIYVTIDDIINHKKIDIETIDGFKKSLTIPFKDGRMITKMNKKIIELRIKENASIINE